MIPPNPKTCGSAVRFPLWIPPSYAKTKRISTWVVGTMHLLPLLPPTWPLIPGLGWPLPTTFLVPYAKGTRCSAETQTTRLLTSPFYVSEGNPLASPSHLSSIRPAKTLSVKPFSARINPGMNPSCIRSPDVRTQPRPQQLMATSTHRGSPLHFSNTNRRMHLASPNLTTRRSPKSADGSHRRRLKVLRFTCPFSPSPLFPSENHPASSLLKLHL
jgi:hypothetical protein